MIGENYIDLGKKYVKKHNNKEIIDLLFQLDSMFDTVDCALDCPCHTYCDKHADRTLCTVITVAVEDLKNNR